MIDMDDNRLAVAKTFGATHTINSSDGKAVEKVMKLTNDKGVDVAIEAVGLKQHLNFVRILLPLADILPILEFMEKVLLFTWKHYGQRI